MVGVSITVAEGVAGGRGEGLGAVGLAVVLAWRQAVHVSSGNKSKDRILVIKALSATRVSV